MRVLNRALLVLGIGTAVWLRCTPVNAVGFALAEQSIVNLGYGLAGSAAMAEDASAVYYNPAGMVRLKSAEVDGGLAAIAFKVKFTNEGSVGPAGPAFPLGGGNGGNAGGLSWIPSFYVAAPFNDQLAFGLGVNVPYGLSTTYESGWVGRYQAIDSDIKTLLVNPSFAYRLTESVSIGVGLDAQYLHARLSNAIDFGTACFASPFGPAYCAAAGIAPGTADGTVTIKGDSWAFGYNVGVLIEIAPEARIGLAYRSRLKHRLEGTADFANPNLPPPLNALTAPLVNSNASTAITTPDTVSLSARVPIRRDAWLYADVTWTHWALVDEVRIQLSNGLPDTVLPAYWRNTTRVALGAGWAVDDRFTVRGGVSFEPSTVPNQYRTARVPDDNVTYLGLGLTYCASPSFKVDVAYGHVFEPSAPINNTIIGAGTLVGSSRISANIVGAQVRVLY